MCGIAGFIASGPLPLPREVLAAKMIACIEHRGPDAGDVWQSAQFPVTLGHRRLAIVDLSETGAQPMTFADAGIAMVYNGEVYNFQELRAQLSEAGHSFRGTSDSEVVLRGYQEWGEDLFVRLNGMFALAILDEKRGKLVLARDRSGQKPLYYTNTARGFAFASEVKSLRVWDPELNVIDAAGLNDYLAYGYGLEDRCLTQGVSKLVPATTLSVDLQTGAQTRKTFWDLPALSDKPLSDSEALEQLEAELTAAIDRHFVSDVPVGVLLSGGIDSSLITALAAKARGEVKTFSVAFPNSKRDETTYARQISQAFGTEHHELEISAMTMDTLQDLAWQFDDPIADHAIVPMWHLSKAIRAHVTVALGGDGGDELFGGYPHYGLIGKQAKLRKIPSVIRRLAGVAQYLPAGTKGRNHLVGMQGDLGRAIAQVNLYFDQSWRRKLTGSAQDGRPEDTRASLSLRENGSPLQRAMAADFKTTMAEGYMTKVDRAAMLTSLEIRAPFLDNQMIDFAWHKVPDHLKHNGQMDKVLPRRLAAKLLPTDVAKKPKQGLTMPLETWLNQPQGAFVKEVLLDGNQNLFDRKSVETLFAHQKKGRNNSGRLFALAMAVLWADAHGMARA